VTRAALRMSLLLLTAACSKPHLQAEEKAAEAPVVPVAVVARHDLDTSVTLTAEFEPYQEIDVLTKVPGYVREITVDVGDRVRHGQILATLDVPEMQDELSKAGAGVQLADAELAAATEEAKRTESSHELAHLSYERIRRVADSEPGLVPRQEVDEVRVRDMVAEAQMSAARSSLKAAEQKTHVSQSERARLETMFHYTSIVAPYDAVVTRRYANVGSMLQPGGAPQANGIVRIAEEKRLRLILPVPELAVPSLRIGAPVSVLVPSLGRTIDGHVARFTNRIQQSTRTMDTQVDVTNDDRLLVPGMYAQVELSTTRRPNALSVPLDAIDRSGGTPRAYAVSDDGVVHVSAVTLGLETSQLVEVRSGLIEGQRVILGRHADLHDAERVRPRMEGR
jgi:RND family efflux transporter MFP subunit